MIAAQPIGWTVVYKNEVGLGLVPPYPLRRVYRDALGQASQRIPLAADRVLFMVAGLPMQVKSKGSHYHRFRTVSNGIGYLR